MYKDNYFISHKHPWIFFPYFLSFFFKKKKKKLTTTTEVENYPGFPEGVTGPEMMDKFREQSLKFGTKIYTETISKVDLSSRPFKLWREGYEDKEPLTADSVIVATGAAAKRLNLPGEDFYWQKGISACAVCDGEYFIHFFFFFFFVSYPFYKC